MKKCCFAKFISLISAIAVLIVVAVPVFAVDAVKLSQSADISDKTVIVKIGVAENSGLATFAATLGYDAEKLEFASITYGAGNTNATNTKESGKVGINMVWTEAMSVEGTLATIVFNVKPGAEGKVDLPLSVDFATDKDNADISVTASSASVSIPKGLVPATTAAGGGTEGNVNSKNPNTSGTAIKVGGAGAVIIAAAAIGTAVIVKKKKEA